MDPRDPCDAPPQALPGWREALECLLAAAVPVEGTEELPLAEAEGRILAQEVRLDRAEPPVPRSAMDGFALRAADGEAPRRLLPAIYAGTAELPEIGPGEAAPVMTGGTVPPGADAVVPVEHTRVEEGRLHLEAAVEPGAHVRRAGEMGRAGRVLLAPGLRLRLPDLIAAAGCGQARVRVRRRPRAAVWSTGDEVVPWTARPADHQVRDSNRFGTVLQLRRAGAEVAASNHAPDRQEDLEAGLGRALEEAEILVTLGGVSMGERDLLPGVFAALGVERLFHKVWIQPGKPVWAGRRGRTLVVGLPGNPVSSFTLLELFVVPLVARLAGERAAGPRPLWPGVLAGEARSGARPRFLPAGLMPGPEGELRVRPLPATGSGDWTSLAGARALLHLPPRQRAGPGDPVQFLFLDPPGPDPAGAAG